MGQLIYLRISFSWSDYARVLCMSFVLFSLLTLKIVLNFFPCSHCTSRTTDFLSWFQAQTTTPSLFVCFQCLLILDHHNIVHQLKLTASFFIVVQYHACFDYNEEHCKNTLVVTRLAVEPVIPCIVAQCGA